MIKKVNYILDKPQKIKLIILLIERHERSGCTWQHRVLKRIL